MLGGYRRFGLPPLLQIAHGRYRHRDPLPDRDGL
jgi:hypothetical protein